MADTNQDQKENLSPEQIAEKRAKIIQYYTEQMQVTKLQAEYEKLKADIACDITRGFEAKVKLAHLSQGPTEKTKQQSEKK